MIEKIILLFQMHLGIAVSEEEISSESVIFLSEELDGSLLPDKDFIANLPVEVMTHVYQFNDDFCFVLEDMLKPSKLLLVGVVKAGELIYWEEGIR